MGETGYKIFKEAVKAGKRAREKRREEERKKEEKLEEVIKAFGGKEGFIKFFEEGRAQFKLFFEREVESGNRIGPLLWKVFRTAGKGKKVRSYLLRKIYKRLREPRRLRRFGITYYLRESDNSPFVRKSGLTRVDLRDKVRKMMKNEVNYLLNKLGGEGNLLEVLDDVFGLIWMLTRKERRKPGRLFKRALVKPKFIADLEKWGKTISDLHPSLREKLKLKWFDLDTWLKNCHKFIHKENNFLKSVPEEKIEKEREKIQEEIEDKIDNKEELERMMNSLEANLNRDKFLEIVDNLRGAVKRGPLEKALVKRARKVVRGEVKEQVIKAYKKMASDMMKKRKKVLREEMLILGYLVMFLFFSATIAEFEYYDKRREKESIMGDLREAIRNTVGV